MPGKVNSSLEALRRIFNPRYKSESSQSNSRKKGSLSLAQLAIEIEKNKSIAIIDLKHAREEYAKVKEKINPLFQKRKQENISLFNDVLSSKGSSVNTFLTILEENKSKIFSLKNMMLHRVKYSETKHSLNIAQKRYVTFLDALLRKNDQLLFYLKEIKKINGLSKEAKLPEIFSQKILKIDKILQNLNERKKSLEKDLKVSNDFLSNILPNLKRDPKMRAAGEGKEIFEAERSHENEVKKITSELSDLNKRIDFQKRKKQSLTEKGHEENLKTFLKIQKEKIPLLKEKFKERFPDFITLYQIFMEERSSVQDKYYIDLYVMGKLNEVK